MYSTGRDIPGRQSLGFDAVALSHFGVFCTRYVRKQMILDNTLFKCVCYHRGEYQIITSGTDRKIVYWEVLDGSAIREVQGSLSSSINRMDITSDGASFATGECVVGAGERRSY
ncbi:hypothetical protein Q9966_016458 [Columba livia]|nr:hypothetical protein Q9966_016458 [Columba livia]